MEVASIELIVLSVHSGKIYGTMDDLRLEHQRVQQKYIAMTKALIESCDIDAFRVDCVAAVWNTQIFL